jgi:hypothetical protein
MNSIHSSRTPLPWTLQEDECLLKAANSLKATHLTSPDSFSNIGSLQTVWNNFSTYLESNSFHRSPEEIQKRWLCHLSKFVIPLDNPRHQNVIRILYPFFKKPEEGEFDWESFSKLIANQNQGYYFSPKDLKNCCTRSRSETPTPTFATKEERINYVQNQLRHLNLWRGRKNPKNLEGKAKTTAKRTLSHSSESSEKCIKKTKWTEAEDICLRDAVSLNKQCEKPTFEWTKVLSDARSISNGTFNKDAKQCRERFIQHLKPNTIQKVDSVNRPIIMELCTLFYNHKSNLLPSATISNEIHNQRPDKPKFTALAIRNCYHSEKRHLGDKYTFPLYTLDSAEKQERINYLISQLSYDNISSPDPIPVAHVSSSSSSAVAVAVSVDSSSCLLEDKPILQPNPSELVFLAESEHDELDFDFEWDNLEKLIPVLDDPRH